LNGDNTIFRGGAGLLRTALGLAAVGALGLVLGAFLDRAHLFHAYLAAYAYAVSIAGGALIFLMIGHAMGAGWPVVVRRLTETIVASWPLLALLFLPILFGITTLYPWARSDMSDIAGAPGDEIARGLVHAKRSYLNVPFFVVRSAVYLLVCSVVSALLRRWSLERDADPRADVEGRLRALSAGGLPAVALSFSFASFDWLMSLTPTWFSTMYPVYWFSGGFVAALALLVRITFAAQQEGLLPEVSLSHYYALGRMLLAFVIFWAYAAYFQFFLIWIANRPEEVSFFVDRIQGPWRAISVTLVVAQFVAPFFALLSYRSKHRPRLLAGVAAWILAAHYLDVHWLVMPSARPSAPYHWLDLAALLAVGGACTAFSVTRLRGRAILPIHDPALPRAVRYESR
jgi:hypothetical protein